MKTSLKKLSILVASLVAGFVASAAPVAVVIDNFNAPDVVALQDTLAVGATTSVDAIRTVSLELLAGPADGNGATLSIGSTTFPTGLFEIANASGRDTEALVSWNLAAGVLPASAQSAAFLFTVIQSDGNPTSVEFLLDGLSLQDFLVPRNTSNMALPFALNAANLVRVKSGGLLSMKVNGELGWDMTLDSFGIQYEPATAVPEPGSLALAGLALLGMAAATRRRLR